MEHSEKKPEFDSDMIIPSEIPKGSHETGNESTVLQVLNFEAVKKEDVENKDDCKAHQTSSYESLIKTEADEMPYICDRCDASFTELENLLIHQETHKGEHYFVCSECGAVFTLQEDINGHVKLHKGYSDKGKRNECDLCEKTFKTKISFK